MALSRALNPKRVVHTPKLRAQSWRRAWHRGVETQESAISFLGMKKARPGWASGLGFVGES
eukprot:4547189-Alexandrium_andersonii.AAC.1